VSFQDHFSGHAADYAKARPGYPEALFDWLANRAPGRAQAWDAGCGNGQASHALVRHFRAVFASDPSATQIESALPHSRIRFAVEPAEACSLKDASVDLVAVAQAYHWFDQERFCAEARRVLRPDGLVAVWSYARSSVSPEVDAIVDELHDEALAADWPADRGHVLNRYADLPFAFERLPVPEFSMRERWVLAQYQAYLRSWSGSQRYCQRTGSDPVEAIAAELAEAWGDPSQARDVQWPLLVLVGRS
jgi:SAM-dependent methyltransferase